MFLYFSYKGTGKRGHIVAHDVSWAQTRGTQNECCVSMLRKLGNICCGHKMFLNKVRNIFCVPDTKFVSATSVARAGKRGNICVGNNVSTTMCPRLPGPLVLRTSKFQGVSILSLFFTAKFSFARQFKNYIAFFNFIGLKPWKLNVKFEKENKGNPRHIISVVYVL